MTMDKQALAVRANAWQNAHKPNTGYTSGVFNLLAQTDLPKGTNLLTQALAQYTGRDEWTPGLDLLHFKGMNERRIPYSHFNRFCLDSQTDCSGAVYSFLKIFFNLDIGNWTEAMYWRVTKKAIPWEQRRVGDVILYRFKKLRMASHVSIMAWNPVRGKGGLIAHTTSPANPWRFEADSYGAANRVGVYRVLTEAQYQSLIV
jgi:hypothetical protein